MRLYFGRHGEYRGFSAGPAFWIAAAVVLGVLVLAVGYQLFMIAPVLAVAGLAVWAVATKQWQPRPRKEKAP